jgi:hypothetical protein
MVQIRAFFVALFESKNIFDCPNPVWVSLLSFNRLSSEKIFFFAKLFCPKLDFSALNSYLTPADDI